MKKRLASLMLSIAIAFCGITVYGDGLGTMHDYLPGIINYDQELGTAVDSSGAYIDDEKIIIRGGGYVTYDFILPFDAASLDIEYNAATDVKLIFTTENNKYEASLSKNDTAYTLTLTPEHLGETKMTVWSDSDVTITCLKYSKVPVACQNSDDGIEFDKAVEYTPYQDALKTSVVVAEDSTAVRMRNLIRYINFDDTSEVTTIIDGSMYLPVGTLARAFSLYYEDYPDEEYVYLSGESFAIYLKPSESYIENVGKKSEIDYFVKYVDGRAYLPVRRFAELMGYTVLYRDGVAVIDNRLSANAVFANEEVFEELKKEMSNYTSAAYEGTVYHVAQTKIANDDNIGSAEFPFATINRAAKVAKAGDKVIIHEGVYREKVVPKNSGTASKPIIYKAADGENVTVSAFDKVEGFAPYTNPANGVDMYVASVGALEFDCALPGAWDIDRNFVTYNDEILAEGRHPNSKTSVASTELRFNNTLDKSKYPDQMEEVEFKEAVDLNPAYPDLKNHKLLPTMGDMRVRDVLGKGTRNIVYNHTVRSSIDLNQDVKDYWKGAVFLGFVGKGWETSGALITASKKNEATASEYWDGFIGGLTYYQAKEPYDYGYLTHHLNTVDIPGEWYIDNEQKLLYIIPPEGADPDKMQLDVKARQLTFDLREKNFIQLQNINTRGGSITMDKAVGCVINGGSHKYISQFTLSGQNCVEALDKIYSRYDAILGNVKYSDNASIGNTQLTGEVGFYIGGLYNAVVNTDIEYSSGAGMIINGSYQYIENNKVDKVVYGCTSMAGMNMAGSAPYSGYPAGGHCVYQNTITGAGRATFGGKVLASAPNDIAFNEFAWGNILARDTGVFYIHSFIGGTELTKTQIHHNIIHDSVCTKEGSLLTVDFYSDNYTALCNVYNNIMYYSMDNKLYMDRYIFWQEGIRGSHQEKWSNNTITFDTPDDVKLNVTDYPSGYPFKAGAVKNGDKFMLNINKESDSYVKTLANENISDGAYVTDDNYVVLPTLDESVTVNGIKIYDKGTKMYIYYSADRYTKTIENLPYVNVEFFKDGKSVGTIKQSLFAYAPYLDSISRATVIIPQEYAGCETVKISTNNSDIRFAKIAYDEFDYDKENTKRAIPFGATNIPLGSADEIHNNPDPESPKSSSSTSLTEDDGDALTYWRIGDTRTNGFLYKNRTVEKACDNIILTAGTNRTYGHTKATVYIGGPEGEAIGEVDLTDVWGTHESWHTKNVSGKMFKTLEPGTYDFYVKFDNTTDESGPFYMSCTAYALSLY